MNRFSLHKKYWFCLSLLVLVAATSEAGAQTTITVEASATPLSPAWCIVPMNANNPATSELTASVPEEPTPPEGCALVGPFAEWAVQPTGVQYPTDNVTWTQAPANSYSAMIVQEGESLAPAELQVVYNIGGYWQFPCSIGVSYMDGLIQGYSTSCIDGWFGTTQAVATGNSVQLTSLTVASGATQTNVTQIAGTPPNWAAVKQAGATVLIQATTLPNNADGWAFLQWTGGNPVANNVTQRSVDAGTSAQTTVTAQIGTYPLSVNIWILWATIQILTANPKPANAPSFGGNDDGTENLGTVTWMVRNLQYGAGKICAVATITPAGAGAVVSQGWKFGIKRVWSHDFQDGAQMAGFFDTNWVEDPTLANLTPDGNDRIYEIDGPNVGQFQSKNDTQVYNNFQEYVQWNGDAASDYAYWYYKGRWQGAKNPQITVNEVGTGNITLPNNPAP